jgi:hypothetical protein
MILWKFNEYKYKKEVKFQAFYTSGNNMNDGKNEKKNSG